MCIAWYLNVLHEDSIIHNNLTSQMVHIRCFFFCINLSILKIYLNMFILFKFWDWKRCLFVFFKKTFYRGIATLPAQCSQLLIKSYTVSATIVTAPKIMEQKSNRRAVSPWQHFTSLYSPPSVFFISFYLLRFNTSHVSTSTFSTFLLPLGSGLSLVWTQCCQYAVSCCI